MLRHSLALLALLAATPALADGMPVTIYDQAGNALGTAKNPLNVTGGGGGGGGGSAGGAVSNTPAPGTAGEFGNPPTAPTGTALGTVPANATRAGYWFFENQSTALLTVVMDDGNGNAVSVTSWGAAPAVGGQGGTTGSQDTGPHLGRIRVFGPSGSLFTLRAQ